MGGDVYFNVAVIAIGRVFQDVTTFMSNVDFLNKKYIFSKTQALPSL